jgi:AAA15 family ATPase/GTPase
MGGGINRLFSILVNMNSIEGGFLGIDEVENGFHHSKLTGVFAALLDGRKRSRTHLAMATHSIEALVAMAQAAGDRYEEDLAIVHMHREKDDSVRAHVYGGRDAIASVELGYEVR